MKIRHKGLWFLITVTIYFTGAILGGCVNSYCTNEVEPNFPDKFPIIKNIIPHNTSKFNLMPTLPRNMIRGN